jgi:hypothetical protein
MNAFVHVHAPQPDACLIIRNNCTTCKRRSFMVLRDTLWYGCNITCLRCGEQWHNGERAERPFAPRWREKNKEHARAMYRRLSNVGQTQKAYKHEKDS